MLVRKAKSDLTAVYNASVLCPSPYQKPHPPVFVAASKSQASIDFCARNGFIPTYFMPTKGVVELSHYYERVATETGFNVQLGQNQNIVRWPHFAADAEGYDKKLREYDLDIYKNFYGPFFPQFPHGHGRRTSRRYEGIRYLHRGERSMRLLPSGSLSTSRCRVSTSR